VSLNCSWDAEETFAKQEVGLSKQEVSRKIRVLKVSGGLIDITMRCTRKGYGYYTCINSAREVFPMLLHSPDLDSKALNLFEKARIAVQRF
jgi:hypothetical protein